MDRDEEGWTAFFPGKQMSWQCLSTNPKPQIGCNSTFHAEILRSIRRVLPKTSQNPNMILNHSCSIPAAITLQTISQTNVQILILSDVIELYLMHLSKPHTLTKMSIKIQLDSWPDSSLFVKKEVMVILFFLVILVLRVRYESSREVCTSDEDLKWKMKFLEGCLFAKMSSYRCLFWLHLQLARVAIILGFLLSLKIFATGS